MNFYKFVNKKLDIIKGMFNKMKNSIIKAGTLLMN